MKLTNRFFLFSLGISLVIFSCRPTEELPGIAEIPTASAEEVGMSTAKLQAITELLDAHLDSAHIPCAEIMVLRKGKIAYQYSGGYQDFATKKPLVKGTIYRLASMTKPITGTAIMILHDEGKLTLDDPVSKFIPEFANPTLVDEFNEEDTTYTTKPASREITIRDLLTHTSGINYPVFDPTNPASKICFKAGIQNGFCKDEVYLADNIKKLAGLPLSHNPGEKYSYGMSIDVLGYVVEVLSGMSLADFFEQRIFEPLGMDDTHFYLPENKYDRLVSMYGQDKEGELRSAQEVDPIGGALIDYPIAGAKTYYSGGAGLVGTTEDYARFGLMMTNGGELYGNRILSEEAVLLMSSNHLDPEVFGERQYGLSMRVSDARPESLHPEKRGSFGWGGYFKTRYTSNPSDEMVVIGMTQSIPNEHVDKIFNQVTRLIYGAIEREPAKELGVVE